MRRSAWLVNGLVIGTNSRVAAMHLRWNVASSCGHVGHLEPAEGYMPISATVHASIVLTMLISACMTMFDVSTYPHRDPSPIVSGKSAPVWTFKIEKQ
jgi:hypothetical protein